MLYLGADHAGFKLKETIKKYLSHKNIKFKDLGNHKFVKTDDYPNFAKLVAEAVSRNQNHQGILICGSGQGMCTTANKFKKIRASIGYSIQAVKDARTDGNSNILCLPGRSLSRGKAVKIVNIWLNTPFSNLPRHKRRLEKITKL